MLRLLELKQKIKDMAMVTGCDCERCNNFSRYLDELIKEAGKEFYEV